jgi:hypothetical protein
MRNGVQLARRLKCQTEEFYITAGVAAGEGLNDSSWQVLLRGTASVITQQRHREMRLKEGCFFGCY